MKQMSLRNRILYWWDEVKRNFNRRPTRALRPPVDVVADCVASTGVEMRVIPDRCSAKWEIHLFKPEAPPHRGVVCKEGEWVVYVYDEVEDAYGENIGLTEAIRRICWMHREQHLTRR